MTTVAAWDANSLIPDLFVDNEIKTHIISTHVIRPQTSMDLPKVLDNKSAQRRLATIIGHLEGRTPRGMEQQYAAIETLLIAFNRRPAEYQRAVLALPSVQQFREPHLADLPDDAVFALYLCMMNSQNTDANDFVAQTDLASKLNLTTVQRKKMIKAFAASEQGNTELWNHDFSIICRYLMPDYYMGVDVSHVR